MSLPGQSQEPSAGPSWSSPGTSVSAPPFPSQAGKDDSHQGASGEGSMRTPTTKRRNACTVCRRRKLRCDGATPSCGNCSRLKHDCSYVEIKRKSGPKLGYVKRLETRLAQVEELLKNQDAAEPNRIATPTGQHDQELSSIQFSTFDVTYTEDEMKMSNMEAVVADSHEYQVQGDLFSEMTLEDQTFVSLNEGFSWRLIELGVEEPLPPQDAIDELTEIYFTRVHPSMPIIHQYRFLAAMNLSPRARPSVALRYAMWTLAALITEKYKNLHSHFYVRAKKYVAADETAGRQKFINVRHAQAFILIAKYEFKTMIFPNAWLTTSRATRLTQMMGLHRLDRLGLDVMQSLPTPADWTEKEERRRTFWMTFIMERFSSSGNGWPMIVDERDILTDLPSSEEAYTQNEDIPGISFNHAMDPTSGAASKLSSFGGSVVVACLAGRILHHLQRPSPDNDDKNLNGHFWKAHRKMDNVLLNTSLYLPSHLRLPAGLSNPNTIFLNMSLQATIICLHQAAIFKAEKLELPTSVTTDSRDRCVAAAAEILSIMKRIAHMDLAMLNTHTPFSLYVAARIFARVLKAESENDDAKSSVRFLLSALLAIKDSNPLAESYLVQLDLEGVSLASLQENAGVADLGKSVAGISLVEETDEWVTFVSPLVRIVEQTEESGSSPSTAKNNRGNPAAPSGSSSNPKDATRHGVSEDHINSMATPEDMDIFVSTETWNLEGTRMPPDIFDSLMGFGSNDQPDFG